MAVPAGKIEKYASLKDSTEGNKTSIQQLESYFGFDKINPIRLSNSDELDVNEKGDSFKDWYESELKRLSGEND